MGAFLPQGRSCVWKYLFLPKGDGDASPWSLSAELSQHELSFGHIAKQHGVKKMALLDSLFKKNRVVNFSPRFLNHGVLTKSWRRPVPAPPGRQGALRQFPGGRGWERGYCACTSCRPPAVVRGCGARAACTLRMRTARRPLAEAARGGGGGPAGSHERVRGCGAAFGLLGYGGDPERQQRQPGEDRHVPR